MSTQHCNGINSALKFFFRFVLKKSWDQDVVPRMINDKTLPRVMTLEQVEMMIDASNEVRNKAIIALLYSSGLRVGELCRLQAGDIHMGTMQVHIRGGKILVFLSCEKGYLFCWIKESAQTIKNKWN